MASRYTRPAAALAAAALVAIAGALLHGPTPKPAGASRVLVDAYCDDGDGGTSTLTVDVRTAAGAQVDGGWASWVKQRTGCTPIDPSVRTDLADANSWPAQASEVKTRTGQFRCRCLSAALPQRYVSIPCRTNAGHHDIAIEYCCLAGSNAEIIP